TPVDQDHSLARKSVAKATPSDPADARQADHNGQVINYTIAVANTGNETLTGVTVTDPFADAAPVLIGGDTNANGKLDVGETWTYSAQHTVTQGEIDAGNNLVNTASVTDTQGDTGSSSATTPVDQDHSLSIAKSVTSVVDTNNNHLTDAGDVINYNVVATNTGNVTLTNVTI